MSVRREILDEHLEWFNALGVSPSGQIFIHSFNGQLRPRNIRSPNGWYLYDDASYFTVSGFVHSVDDYPSYIFQGGDSTIAWYDTGRLHRETGPAVINSIRDVISAYWYLDGVHIGFNEWTKVSRLSDAEKVQLKMVWE